MDHMQFLCVRSHQEPQEEISGHALMATCPPHEHIVNHPEVPYPHKTWDVPNPDLMKLLELSERLPLDGEITPVMALKIIRVHERFGELTAEDFEVLKDDLKAKVRCYGYVTSEICLGLCDHCHCSPSPWYPSDYILSITTTPIARTCFITTAKVKLANPVNRFGAVLEEFEVRDALSSVFATKLESYTAFA